MEADWKRSEQYVELVMASWKISPTWKFCLQRVMTDGRSYTVEALFSIPTRHL